MEINETNTPQNLERGFPRLFTYFISVLIFSFLLFLSIYLIPILIIFLDFLVYVITVIFSFVFSFLFRYLLDRSKSIKVDYILLPVILSTIGSFGFSFINYMVSLAQLSKQGLNQFLTPPNILFQISLPNVNLLFILFIIFFNILFIHRYSQLYGKKKYFLLYLIPIFCFIFVSSI